MLLCGIVGWKMWSIFATSAVDLEITSRQHVCNANGGLVEVLTQSSDPLKAIHSPHL